MGVVIGLGFYGVEEVGYFTMPPMRVNRPMVRAEVRYVRVRVTISVRSSAQTVP